MPATVRQPAGDQVGAAGGAERVADRDQRAEHDEDRPFDRCDRPRAAAATRTARAARRRRRRRPRPARRRRRRAPSSRPGSRPASSRARALPSRERCARPAAGSRARAASRAGRASTPCSTTTSPARSGSGAQPLGDALAAAADREQVDAEALVAARSASAVSPIRSEFGADHRLDDADLVGRLARLGGAMLAGVSSRPGRGDERARAPSARPRAGQDVVRRAASTSGSGRALRLLVARRWP